jgi:hypothetical protein
MCSPGTVQRIALAMAIALIPVVRKRQELASGTTESFRVARVIRPEPLRRQANDHDKLTYRFQGRSSAEVL